MSVITNPSESQEIRHIKLEKEEKEVKYLGQNADSTVDTDSQQENTEGETDEVKKEHFDETKDCLSNYVHKKFRPNVEISEKSSENSFILKRKSVIFHAISSKKICV